MIQKGLAMKRYKSIKIRKIKYNIYYTIRGIILLPIRLLLLPFKLIGKLLFYRKRKPNKTVLTIIFNKLRNTNERITSLNDIHSHRIDKLNKDMSKWVNFAVDSKAQVDSDIDKLNNKVNKISINTESYDESISFIEEQIDELSKVKKDINELQLSLESMKPKDLGTFNFINDELSQVDLAQIEAELDGERVAREEYDWHREQKAKDKQIQDRMRADEAEYDRLSEPVNLDD